LLKANMIVDAHFREIFAFLEVPCSVNLSLRESDVCLNTDFGTHQSANKVF
jgi:hypothetical protein